MQVVPPTPFSIHSSTSTTLSECQNLLQGLADFYAPYESFAHKIHLATSSTSLDFMCGYYRSWHTLDSSLPSRSTQRATDAIRACRGALGVLQALFAVFRRVLSLSGADLNTTDRSTEADDGVDVPLLFPFRPEVVGFLLNTLAALQGHLVAASADWQICMLEQENASHGRFLTDSYALIQACEGGCAAGARHILNSIGYGQGLYELEIACTGQTNSVLRDLIIERVIKERHAFQSALVETLSKDEAEAIGLHFEHNTLLDRHAARACRLPAVQKFKIKEFEIPKESQSVYDSRKVTLEIQNRLWDAGFRDVDFADDGGYTALMHIDDDSGFGPKADPVLLLEKACWLVSKGADLSRDRKSSPALHYVAHAVGDSMMSADVTRLSGMDEGCWQILRTCFLDTAQDTCRCSCSEGGCSALTRFLDGLFKRDRRDLPRNEQLEYGRSALLMVLRFMASTLGLGPEEKLFYDKIAPAVLRYIICSELGITHTCFHNVVVPEEIIIAIHDGEKSVIEELDGLVAAQIQRYTRAAISLPEFLVKTWRVRAGHPEVDFFACSPR
ncbi:hypothetical protein BJX63DRAFT_411824 [Aspergillus granulosus]|uniref:Uncharacterized protein n=1 Tax=Aspergillus granulosus TaxID=176169 RepID=A0ABR4GYD2_9EURO